VEKARACTFWEIHPTTLALWSSQRRVKLLSINTIKTRQYTTSACWTSSSAKNGSLNASSFTKNKSAASYSKSKMTKFKTPSLITDESSYSYEAVRKSSYMSASAQKMKSGPGRGNMRGAKVRGLDMQR
jgi:hypothetical protein